MRKISVAQKRIGEWAILTAIVSTDALESEVHTVSNLTIETTRTVDRQLAIDAVARKEHHAANGIAESLEILVFLRRKFIDDR